MSEQLSLLERVLVHEAREAGRQAGEAALAKAATRRDFDREGCKKFMLSWIRRHQRVSGEDLTTAAAKHGYDPGERRAYGPVIAALVREGLIRCDGYVPRRFGHGCAGGRVWTAVR